MTNRLFSEQKVPEPFVLDYLYKIYLGTLKSMVEGDEEFLSEYLEKGFAERLVRRIKEMREKGYRFKVAEELVSRHGTLIPSKVEIIDSVFIRGLSTDRSKNQKEEKYHVFNDVENLVASAHPGHAGVHAALDHEA